MWPRHTGDFTLLRIYTAPDGTPAEYSEENIPMKPKHPPVSLDGVEEGDYAMIMGFPGSTDRYLTSYGVQQALDQKNPTIVKIRDKKLAIMREHMNAKEKFVFSMLQNMHNIQLLEIFYWTIQGAKTYESL